MSTAASRRAAYFELVLCVEDVKINLLPSLGSAAGRSVEVAKTSAEAVFVVRGRRVQAWLTSFGISIIPASTRWWRPWARLRYVPDAIMFEEVLSVATHQRSQRMSCECPSSKVDLTREFIPIKAPAWLVVII